MSVLRVQKYYFFSKRTRITRFLRILLQCMRSKFVQFVQFVVYNNSVVLNLIECLSQVFDDIVDVLSTDAQAHGGRSDVLLSQFLLREL